MQKRKYIMAFLFLLLIGCNSDKPKEYPEDTQFSILSSYSTHSPKVGEDITVNVIFQNNSNFTYEIERGPELILIQPREITDSIGFVVTGPGVQDKIKANKKYEITRSIKFEKPGRYAVNLAASFSIELNGHYKNYLIPDERIEINVS